MELTYSEKIDKRNPVKPTLVVLCGVILGSAVWTVLGLEGQWGIFLLVGLAVPIAAVVTRDVKRFLMLVLIFSIPINADVHFFYREHHGGAAGISVSLFDLVLVVLYLLWFIELYLRRERTIHLSLKTTIPTLCLIGVSALSIVKATDVELSIFEVIRFVKVFLAYLYVLNHVRSKTDVGYILAALLVGLFFQSALAFLQNWFGVSFGLKVLGEAEELRRFYLGYSGAMHRVGGTVGNPNDFAKYLIFLLPLPLVLVFAPIRKILKPVCMAVFALGTIALIITFSRGGWLAFALSITLVLFFVFRDSTQKGKRVFPLILVLGLLVLLVVSFYGLLASRFTVQDNASAAVRIPLMQVAWAIIQDHPILGVGINNYPVIMAAYGDPSVPFTMTSRVHNVYLLIAAETGLIGFCIFIWFLISIFKQVLLPGKIDARFFAFVSTGVMGGFVANLIHFQVDPHYIGGYTLFWVLTGLLVAIRRIHSEPRMRESLQ